MKNSAEECCQSCMDYKPKNADDAPCNVWVWCGHRSACKHAYKNCWLKHLAWPDAVVPLSGPNVPWTSGLAQPRAVSKRRTDFGGAERAFHTVTTVQGNHVHWQARVHYYWFKKQQRRCREELGDACQMGGFTRLLHSGKEDDLMDEIPTYVVNPLPTRHQTGYVVLNRPYAFLQWTQQVRVKERFVLMSEPDHIFLRPLPNLMVGDRPAAFPFFYIEPSRSDYVHITQKFTPVKSRKEAEAIAPIGSSPTFMLFEDLKAVAGDWVDTAVAIFKDAEANKEWGWVMEMYAFTLSLFNHKVGPVDLHLELAAQPPWDAHMSRGGVPYHILHYTYGNDYTLEGKFTPGEVGAWHFDKRDFARRPPPRHLQPPPNGTHNDLVRFLINAINEASDNIPGWDDYSLTGKALQHMRYDD